MLQGTKWDLNGLNLRPRVVYFYFCHEYHQIPLVVYLKTMSDCFHILTPTSIRWNWALVFCHVDGTRGGLVGLEYKQHKSTFIQSTKILLKPFTDCSSLSHLSRFWLVKCLYETTSCCSGSCSLSTEGCYCLFFNPKDPFLLFCIKWASLSKMMSALAPCGVVGGAYPSWHWESVFNLNKSPVHHRTTHREMKNHSLTFPPADGTPLLRVSGGWRREWEPGGNPTRHWENRRCHRTVQEDTTYQRKGVYLTLPFGFAAFTPRCETPTKPSEWTGKYRLEAAGFPLLPCDFTMDIKSRKCPYSWWTPISPKVLLSPLGLQHSTTTIPMECQMFPVDQFFPDLTEPSELVVMRSESYWAGQ